MANNIKINFNNLPKLLQSNPQVFDDAVDALAHHGESHVKGLIKNSPPTGKSYVKPSGNIHVASSPDNPPRIDDGILINSIHVSKAGTGKRRIVSGAEYSIELEFGTSKMEPRPFMSPMAAYIQQNAVKFFKDLIE